MEVLIVGAGAMGTWFGRSVGADVAFADVDDSAAARAAEVTGSRVVPLEGEERFDAVCLAVPMDAVASAIETQAPRAEAAVLDVSGLMGEPLAAMDKHAPERERVSLHPLFAPERAPGSIPVVRDRSGPVTDELLAALEASGNVLVETTAAEHDAAMESVQSAAHAAVFSFALAAESVPEGFETPVYERLRELVELVTDGTPRVYADVQRTFDGADDVAAAAARVAAAEGDDLEALHREAAERWRDSTTGDPSATGEGRDAGGDP